MRRTVRTAAIVMGAAAATGLGLATAGAQPDAATAQAPQSYQLTSSTMTVPVNPLNYPTSHGLCGDGYHVAGDWVRPSGQWIEQYLPSVHANGDSDIYVNDTHPDESSQNGSDSNGRPYYRGLYVTLGNHSWTQAKQGSFTWTCEPN
jgi:hypothetical protein